MRIIGTAGHVDHGKSTLITALTGTDPDRLPEEKRRGMTIDLGFAWLRLPNGQEVSIVDVPGHERFIGNMLAGAGGIDVALLVVAADEGVMPQTREHTDILGLLGVTSGVVAIAKVDQVDEEWLDLVKAEVEEYLSETPLAGAPIVPVSAIDGQGLPELAAALQRAVEGAAPRAGTGRARLPIDRVFTVAGFGTVVTGSLTGGALKVGDEQEIQPSGLPARVRGLQTHKRKMNEIAAPARVAVNLAGVSRDQVRRGDVLTSPGWLVPTRVLDARFRLLPSVPWPLAHNTAVALFTGTSETVGRVSLLGTEKLLPGESGWVQLRLAAPVAVVKGDFYVLRLLSPGLTLGGGRVVDVHPHRHRRFQARVLEKLAVLESGSTEGVVLKEVETRGPVEWQQLLKVCGLSQAEAQEAVAGLVHRGEMIVFNAVAGGSSERAGLTGADAGLGRAAVFALAPQSILVSAAGWRRIAQRLEDSLQSYHREHPLRLGMPREELRTRVGLGPRLFSGAMAMLVRAGAAVEEGPLVRQAAHRSALTPEQEQQVHQLMAGLKAAGASPPPRAELTSRYRVEDELVQALIERGELLAVAEDILYARETYDQMVEELKARLVAQGSVTVGQVRDLLSTSRKYALAFLQHLDERRITRRVGDERVLF